MKKIASISAVCLIAFAYGQAAVNLSGTAVSGNFLGVGDTALLLADTTGTGFDEGTIFGSALSGQLNSDLNLSDGSIYGSGLVVLDSTVSGTNFLGTPFAGFNTTFNLGAVSTGNEFGVLVFNSSTTTTTLGDTYTLYLNPTLWLVPSDSGTNTLSTITSPSTFGGTVVPEPSAFALLAGCIGLAWVMVRRRS